MYDYELFNRGCLDHMKYTTKYNMSPAENYYNTSVCVRVCLSLCVCSRRGQMFERRRGRRLWILLLPGELNLRHGRDARDL